MQHYEEDLNKLKKSLIPITVRSSKKQENNLVIWKWNQKRCKNWCKKKYSFRKKCVIANNRWVEY